MAGTPESTTPAKTTRDTIVIDLGKKRQKQINALKQGQGPLMVEVHDVLSELKASGAITGTVQPVVVVVTKKDEDNVGVFPFFGFLK